ncbi:MAG: FkbM family methyltransferase [Cryomorphaceae bacterium]|nr:FkbM family methyltransferase [Cryomorphaceae bacterium]
MKTTKLPDGTRVYALRAPEARMLDHHVDGYLQNGIEINDGDVVFDVGANIGVFSVRAAQKGPNVRVFAFEPIPDILEALRLNAAGAGENRVEVLPCGVSNEESASATINTAPRTMG